MSAARRHFGSALALLLLAGSLGPAAAITAAAPASTTAKPAAAKPAQVLPWMEDDYPRAVAEAKARKVPMFVESWAPW